MHSETWVFSCNTLVTCHRVCRSNRTSKYTFFCSFSFITALQGVPLQHYPIPTYLLCCLIVIMNPKYRRSAVGWDSLLKGWGGCLRSEVTSLMNSFIYISQLLLKTEVAQWDCSSARYMGLKSLLAKSALPFDRWLLFATQVDFILKWSYESELGKGKSLAVQQVGNRRRSCELVNKPG